MDDLLSRGVWNSKPFEYVAKRCEEDVHSYVDDDNVDFSSIKNKKNGQRVVEASKFMSHVNMQPFTDYCIDDPSRKTYLLYPESHIRLDKYLMSLSKEPFEDRFKKLVIILSDVALFIDYAHTPRSGHRNPLLLRHICKRCIFIELDCDRRPRARVRLIIPKFEKIDVQECSIKKTELPCGCPFQYKPIDAAINDWTDFRTMITQILLPTENLPERLFPEVSEIGGDVKVESSCKLPLIRYSIASVLHLADQKKPFALKHVRIKEYVTPVHHFAFKLLEIRRQLKCGMNFVSNPEYKNLCNSCLIRPKCNLWLRQDVSSGTICDRECVYYCSDCYNITAHVCSVHGPASSLVGGENAYVIIITGDGFHSEGVAMENGFISRHTCNIPIKNIRKLQLGREIRIIEGREPLASLTSCLADLKATITDTNRLDPLITLYYCGAGFKDGGESYLNPQRLPNDAIQTNPTEFISQRELEGEIDRLQDEFRDKRLNVFLMAPLQEFESSCNDSQGAAICISPDSLEFLNSQAFVSHLIRQNSFEKPTSVSEAKATGYVDFKHLVERLNSSGTELVTITYMSMSSSTDIPFSLCSSEYVERRFILYEGATSNNIPWRKSLRYPVEAPHACAVTWLKEQINVPTETVMVFLSRQNSAYTFYELAWRYELNMLMNNTPIIYLPNETETVKLSKFGGEDIIVNVPTNLCNFTPMKVDGQPELPNPYSSILYVILHTYKDDLLHGDSTPQTPKQKTFSEFIHQVTDVLPDHEKKLNQLGGDTEEEAWRFWSALSDTFRHKKPQELYIEHENTPTITICPRAQRSMPQRSMPQRSMPQHETFQ